ncbi:MAG: Rid family hydrolase [Actinomycetota bacterium]|nr:Rid family hydrolase [Actinomycetota bacterium]
MASCAQYSLMDLGGTRRLVTMITPEGRGDFISQAGEGLAAMQSILRENGAAPVFQTVFLRDAGDQGQCQKLLSAHYGTQIPVTSFVYQPPCTGAALAMEVWAIGGPSVRIERFSQGALAVAHDGVRWVYVSGATPGDANPSSGAHAQTINALGRMQDALVNAGSSFENVIRTWFYIGGITGPDKAGAPGPQRYIELNRARAGFYRGVRFCPNVSHPDKFEIYPSSTGIGMKGEGLAASCLAMETGRSDVMLMPLENPQQTPAYEYSRVYSLKSPKFSRAMALAMSDYVTIWISGTASILNSESLYPDDVEKQTEQTIENIERLISAENFAVHGAQGIRAGLQDLAKVRVYVKRPEDFARCKAVCDRLLAGVPAIYTVADVCRPELLVEIEGAAFVNRK